MSQGKKQKGKKLKETLVSSNGEISKYKNLKEISFIPGRPGEEVYEVVDENGKKTRIFPDEKRKLDRLLKK